MRQSRRILSCLPAFLLALPAAAVASTTSASGSGAGLAPGSAWDSGPGRHRAAATEPDLRTNAARSLELRGLRQDESRETRAAHDLRQAVRESARHRDDPHLRSRLDRDRRFDDAADRADRSLALDAAALSALPGPGPSPAEAVRARMMRALDRTQQRVERRTGSLHRRGRYGTRTSHGLGSRH
ncbi:MAG: hypothetical protein JRG76_02860 [Deltaproteobacteria bacterium]|nr:hypothetical protein [Deltaproteobacteria bacterium]MBW2413430.1 hypothetical protein [Deltaproteobacteria bacterium]